MRCWANFRLFFYTRNMRFNVKVRDTFSDNSTVGKIAISCRQVFYRMTPFCTSLNLYDIVNWMRPSKQSHLLGLRGIELVDFQ